MKVLFVGGVWAGQVHEVGDPPPAEMKAEQFKLIERLPTTVDRLEETYRRSDLRVELPGGPRDFVVYLAGPEWIGYHDPAMQPHVAQHALRELIRVGMVPDLSRPQG